jgi:hypothetical protein
MLEMIPITGRSREGAPLILAPRRRLCARCLHNPASLAPRHKGLCYRCHCDAPASAPCRHCKRAPASRPRGLCWHCFYLPGVRDLYPLDGKFTKCGPGNVYRSAPLPAAPTGAVAGTEEKILVMMARAERGEAVFHPADGPDLT